MSWTFSEFGTHISFTYISTETQVTTHKYKIIKPSVLQPFEIDEFLLSVATTLYLVGPVWKFGGFHSTCTEHDVMLWNVIFPGAYGAEETY